MAVFELSLSRGGLDVCAGGSVDRLENRFISKEKKNLAQISSCCTAQVKSCTAHILPSSSELATVRKLIKISKVMKTNDQISFSMRFEALDLHDLSGIPTEVEKKMFFVTILSKITFHQGTLTSSP